MFCVVIVLLVHVVLLRHLYARNSFKSTALKAILFNFVTNVYNIHCTFFAGRTVNITMSGVPNRPNYCVIFIAHT